MNEKNNNNKLVMCKGKNEIIVKLRKYMEFFIPALLNLCVTQTTSPRILSLPLSW